jgi:hypothetical protein
MSFTPRILSDAIAARVPGFSTDYAPDFRDAIAAGWPHSISDACARRDWGWQPRYDIQVNLQLVLTDLVADLV